MASGIWPRRLTGRCANGAEGDGGRRVHLVRANEGAWGKALCGAKPGRLSNGWDERDYDAATCARCVSRHGRLATPSDEGEG